MSYLSKDFRLNNKKEFSRIYKSGKKWHTTSFVAFFKFDKKFSIAFVASKKVGNAVKRNRLKRKLRAIFLKYEIKIKTGKYIFVAKEKLIDNDYKTLNRDFKFAMKRMELFLN